MKKSILRIVVACCAVIGGLAIILLWPYSQGINSPLTAEMSAMRQITIKLRDYSVGRPATETETLKGKSIDDLVTMHVLSTADAGYLRDHQIRF